ncbi:hypothetical protein M0805_004303 [Coniferiporia weirii]|nr:hypothetical protein M0805_004303 [Coniferiporia weirii]
MSVASASSEGLGCASVKSRHGVSRVEEVTRVEDSLLPFTQMTTSADRPFLRLHCTVPTWSSSPMHCLDLHDLQDLRSRSTVFLHDLLKLLRSIGVQVTYRLTPSNLDLATISISAEGYKRRAQIQHDLLETAQLSEKGKTLLAMTEDGPVIVMT